MIVTVSGSATSSPAEDLCAMAGLARPFARRTRATPGARPRPAEPRVLVSVVAGGQPSGSLRPVLAAILRQGRRPHVVCVLAGPSGGVRYGDLLPWFVRSCWQAGVIGRWLDDGTGRRMNDKAAVRTVVREHLIDVVWTLRPNGLAEDGTPWEATMWQTDRGLGPGVRRILGALTGRFRPPPAPEPPTPSFARTTLPNTAEHRFARRRGGDTPD